MHLKSLIRLLRSKISDHLFMQWNLEALDLSTHSIPLTCIIKTCFVREIYSLWVLMNDIILLDEYPVVWFWSTRLMSGQVLSEKSPSNYQPFSNRLQSPPILFTHLASNLQFLCKFVLCKFRLNNPSRPRIQCWGTKIWMSWNRTIGHLSPWGRGRKSHFITL